MSSLLSYGVGAAVAAYAGLSIDLRLYALGQVFVWLVHLMTHYCNEYFDLSADQANAGTTGWTGGSRVLVEGALRPVVSLVASLVILVCSLAIAITATSGGARAFALLAAGLAWFYTAPPFQFNYRGLGELTVALVLNFLFPFIGGHLQAGSVPHLLPFLCIPIMLIQHARMMIMNLSDYEGDKRVGKRTLAVFLGRRLTVWVFVAEQSLAYVLIGLWTLLGEVPFPVCAILFATLPLLVCQARWLLRGGINDARLHGRIVFWASMHVSLVHCAVLAGLMISALSQGLGSGAAVRLPLTLLVAFGMFLVYQLPLNQARGAAPAAGKAPLSDNVPASENAPVSDNVPQAQAQHVGIK